MPKDRGVEQGDVDGPGMVQLKRGCASRRNELLGLSLELARTTHCTRGACEMNNANAAKPKLSARRQEKGGLADQWYLDCHPLLFLPCLQAFDAANVAMFACKLPFLRLFMATSRWDLQWDRARVFADQLLAKADIIRTMRKHPQPCQDPQTKICPPSRDPWTKVARKTVSRVDQVLGTTEHAMLPAQLSSELSKPQILDMIQSA